MAYRPRRVARRAPTRARARSGYRPAARRSTRRPVRRAAQRGRSGTQTIKLVIQTSPSTFNEGGATVAKELGRAKF